MSGNEILNKKVYSLIGLCKKAGAVASGEFMTEKSIKGGKSFLVIVAADASDNTKKNFRDMTTYYKVPYMEFGDKDNLGYAIGCEFRASLSINNEGLANQILAKFQTNDI
ncbi:MAG: ribosomal L7Ae/L30e/S12e/Gadd45 family protein [Lachnospiraceae bacterium]|nr:ribosomal L7Ae/L30e/S12e/Gadd45 family protein [Lachnospiraceae bacterium]